MMNIRTLRLAALALLVPAALLALRLAWPGRGAAAVTPGPAAPAVLPEAFHWPEIGSGAWDVFRSGEPGTPRPAAGALAARFRLAGIFLVLSEAGPGSDETRCAILDDLQAKEQILAGENERIGSVRIVRVAPDHVVLADGDRQETIVLAAGTLPGSGKRAGPAPAAAAPAKVLETTRFGNRVGETRWEIRREAVMDYYREMMDDPERVANLFLAMKAVRDEENRVAGYRLHMDVGEKDFYSEVGFQDGDIVRKVNSMRMTSQRRAEYFIGEFVQDRLGAVVIDIERNGEPKKLVYLVK